MTRSMPRKRRFVILPILLAGLFAGLAVPLVFKSDRIAFDFEPAGVVAAPHDRYEIGAPLPVHEFSRTVVTSGRLIQVKPPGREMSGKEARSSLQNGTARLALQNAELNIGDPVNGFDAAPYPRYRAVPPPLVAALRELKFLELNIGKGRIKALFPGGFEERLSNAELLVIGRDQHAVSIRGTATWRGQAVAIEVDTGRVRPEEGAMPIIFKMRGRSILVSFTGTLKRQSGLRLEGKTSITISDVKAFASAQFISWPSLFSTSAVSLSGEMDWSDNGIAFKKANVELDNNDATGALTIKRTTGTRANRHSLISGTLAFDRLSLTTVKNDKSRDDSRLPTGWWDAITSIWTIPVAKFFDADLRISANEVVVGDAELGKAAATVSLRNGKLSAQLAKLEFDGGTGDGQLTMNFNDLLPRALIRGRVQGVPLGDLSSALLGVRRIEGRANVTLDLESQGSELRPMMSGLTGKLQVSLAEPGVVGLDVGAFVRPLAANAGQKNLSESKIRLGAALQGTTQIDRLEVALNISNGVAECVRFDAGMGGKVAKIAGRIGFADRQMDLRALIYDHPARKVGELNEPRDGLITARRVSVSGSLLGPTVTSYDVRGLRSALINGLKAEPLDKAQQ